MKPTKKDNIKKNKQKPKFLSIVWIRQNKMANLDQIRLWIFRVVNNYEIIAPNTHGTKNQIEFKYI